jgi:hypothetical protein
VSLPPVYGVFDGRTPCADFIIEFTQFPEADCQRVKWRVTFHQDPATGAPTTYEFKGTQTNGTGTWRIIQGATANPDAEVLQLQSDRGGTVLSLLKVDENVLLFLDREMNLPIGDEYLSYTLSRKDAESRGLGEPDEQVSFAASDLPVPGLESAVFVGNTPCGDGAGLVPLTPADVECEQMKWTLTLDVEADSSPAKFRLEGAYGMAKPNTQDLVDGGTPFEMEGEWTIGRHEGDDMGTVVYRLNPDEAETAISFLRIDGNILLLMSQEGGLMVGNGGWGYTLQNLE